MIGPAYPECGLEIAVNESYKINGWRLRHIVLKIVNFMNAPKGINRHVEKQYLYLAPGNPCDQCCFYIFTDINIFRLCDASIR